ncbi:molybdopterin-dependent oxidoreductase alpha subunit [Wenyingzhuangia heitensis]|uniref:Molybdopterin-dependent oxidoreductase alpha subunit n=1 Tax=Wenyingzhuangia heitensis TaxID=1487859 RepID=A0ABX0U8D8_9FLAO|nr:FdhF/YdeP family oxidoreductase [Wenyingzhuangia heitensis]NIJ44604.1 molybdopterin-dependent oxidoreductase alpha subunit [Wenyingzhuangia heitensis]
MKQQKEVTIKEQAKSAAGVKAVFISLQQIFSRMSVKNSLNVLSKLNQKEGIDCPGCAWPDPSHRSKLGEFCENGVKAIAEEAMEKKADPAFFAKHSVQDLQNQSDYWLGQQGRLTHPMILRENDTHYSPISWKEANKIIGQELNNLNNPNEAAFYTSGRTSNEAAFLYQLFVRMYGTNNLPDCSNMCHESSGVALSKTVGIGKGSVTLDDLYKAEVILIFGQNPATNHPRMLACLEKAKKNGAKVIAINPLKEAGLINFKNPQNATGVIGSGVDIADYYLQIKINEDVALLKAIMFKLFKLSENKPEILDQDFINNKTAGFKEFKEEILSYNLESLINKTGITTQEIDAVVELLANNQKIIACWGMGLTQHVNGVDNIQEVVNLLLMKGSIAKEGAGTCPVRGHSNVQGDRTMGIAEKPSKALLDKISENFGFTPPKEHGYSVVEAITAMYHKNVKVFIGMGGNFLSAAPDTNYTTQALQNCNLTAHISTKLNRSHLTPGKTALILPSMGRTDKFEKNGKAQFITVENSMGVVHSSKGVLTPPSKEVESEPVIVANIAKATLKNSKVDWDFLTDDYNNIRDLIDKTIEGFENFNERVKQPIGFELPNGSRTGNFTTPNKKANFTVNQLGNIAPASDEYIMMTTRSHDQFNTTIYGLDDRYRGIYNGRMVVFMNREDVAKNNLKKGDKVTLYNNYNNMNRQVDGFSVVPYDIPKGCVATYYPESNPLVPIDLIAHSSHTPSSKSIKVKIKK